MTMTMLKRAIVTLIFWFTTTTTTLAYKLTSRRELLEGDVEIFSKDEQPDVLVPKHLGPGDLATVVARDTKKRIDPETFLVGMPPSITEAFQAYVQETGLMDIFQALLYENPVDSGENRVYNLKDGTQWAASRPENWEHEGDMTWIDPADELSYERVLDIWRKAGLDTVLDTLGEKFGVNGLWVDGTSFIIVSKFNGYNMHDDLPGLNTKVFNIIFPLIIPEKGGRLLVADRTLSKEYGINFAYNVGSLVGGDSKHGTGSCDYRETKEFRLAIAVYFDDIDDSTIDELAGDTTAFFPPHGDKKWIYAQAGRHWGYDNSLKTDKGRDPIGVKDGDEQECPTMAAKGQCTEDMEVRNMCLKSCNVYLEDEEYYEMLGNMVGWEAEKGEETSEKEG